MFKILSCHWICSCPVFTYGLWICFCTIHHFDRFGNLQVFFCIECKFGHVNELVHNCLWSVETKRRKLYVYSLTPVSLANILLWSSLALMKRFIDISKFWSKQYAIYIFQTRLWMKILSGLTSLLANLNEIHLLFVLFLIL